MTRRVLVFGNSGSGKSTLAQRLAGKNGLVHMDLDSIAWEPSTPPTRRPLEASCYEIDAFVEAQEDWVIEGCYADLLAHAARDATQMIWLNLSVEDCIANARQRPWEPHKYASQAAQDANLPMLISWIRDYETRDDEFSMTAHRALYDAFGGTKDMRVKRVKD